VFNLSLFLGFPVNRSFEDALSQIDPKVLKLYISEQSDNYLREIAFEGTRYVGKYAGEIAEVADITLLEKNIQSILSKMIPNPLIENMPLAVFAVRTPLI